MKRLGKQTPDEQREPTLVFYQTVCAEINRLREEQWRLTYYFATEALGVIFLLTAKDTDFVRKAGFEWIFTVTQIAAIVMFLILMWMTNLYLFQHRQIRRSLDGKFGFLNLKDSRGEAVTPAAWRAGPVRRYFEHVRLFIPLVLFGLALQFLSVWIIWNAPSSP